ncbi:hypothetical protein QWJ41_21915, partial [Nocardioides sp. SOB44]
ALRDPSGHSAAAAGDAPTAVVDQPSPDAPPVLPAAGAGAGAAAGLAAAAAAGSGSATPVHGTPATGPAT